MKKPKSHRPPREADWRSRSVQWVASATPETMPQQALGQEGPPTEQARVTVLAHRGDVPGALERGWVLLGEEVKPPALPHPLGPCILETTADVPLLTPSWAVPLRAQPQLDQSLYHHIEVPESCPFCVQVPTHSNLGDAVLGLDLHFWSSQISVLLILLLNGKNQQQGQCLGHWAATGT